VLTFLCTLSPDEGTNNIAQSMYVGNIPVFFSPCSPTSLLIPHLVPFPLYMFPDKRNNNPLVLKHAKITHINVRKNISNNSITLAHNYKSSTKTSNNTLIHICYSIMHKCVLKFFFPQMHATCYTYK
jgi:hypothetical protein